MKELIDSLAARGQAQGFKTPRQTRLAIPGARGQKHAGIKVDLGGVQGHRIAGVTTARLLSPGRPNGMLYGPRSPNYGKD